MPVSHCSHPPRQLKAHLAAELLALALCTVALLGARALAADDTSEMPGVMEGKNGEYAWVSLSQVLDEEGRVNHEYFRFVPFGLDKIERAVTAEGAVEKGVRTLEDEECVTYSWIANTPPDATIAEAFLQSTRFVLTGRIVAADQGFSWGTCGTLLKVRVEALLRDSPDYQIGEYAYLFYPYARFSVLGERFCRGKVPGVYRVKIGDGVLIATYNVPQDLESQLVWSPGWDVLFEDAKEGRVVGNPYLQQIIARNAEADPAAPRGKLQLWGDDLPDLRTLAAQVSEVLAASPTSSAWGERGGRASGRAEGGWRWPAFHRAAEWMPCRRPHARDRLSAVAHVGHGDGQAGRS